MKALVTLFVFVAAFPLVASAQYSKEEMKNFDELEVVRKACGVPQDGEDTLKSLGLAVAAIGGHPYEAIRSMWPAKKGVYGVYEYLNEESLDKVLIQLKVKLENKGCYRATGIYGNYMNLGRDAGNAVAEAFNDEEIAYHASYYPASKEQHELYDKCSTMAYTEGAGTGKVEDDPRARRGQLVSQAAEIRAGRKLVFSDWALDDISNVALNKLMIQNNPRTCDDIKMIDAEIVKALVKADALLRQSLKSSGYRL